MGHFFALDVDHGWGFDLRFVGGGLVTNGGRLGGTKDGWLILAIVVALGGGDV